MLIQKRFKEFRDFRKYPPQRAMSFGRFDPAQIVMIDHFVLLSPQSPSPIPTKRSKFDKLQSPAAEKEQKHDWLQSLSKSAQKVCAARLLLEQCTVV